MQDPTLFPFQQQPTKLHFPEQEQLKCPRCDSMNTKFCYYNNYNLSQPRHFCKNCKRYWTKGGTLRNIPMGGASRKVTKRSPTTSKRCTTSSSSSSSPPPSISSSALVPAQEPDSTRVHIDPVVEGSESFSSLLASAGRLDSIFEGLSSTGSGFKMGEFGERMKTGRDPVVNSDPGNNPNNLEMQSTNETFFGFAKWW